MVAGFPETSTSPVLSIRTPQGISAARVKAFTPENVAKFFDIYEPIAAMVDYISV
jgi:hypothetical protein